MCGCGTGIKQRRGIGDGDKLLLENGDNQESNLFLAWVPLRNGTQGRLFQFKASDGDHVDQTPLLDELGFTAKMPLRTEPAL